MFMPLFVQPNYYDAYSLQICVDITGGPGSSHPLGSIGPRSEVVGVLDLLDFRLDIMSRFGGPVGKHVSFLSSDYHRDHHQKPGSKDSHAYHYFQKREASFGFAEKTVDDSFDLDQPLVSLKCKSLCFHLVEIAKRVPQPI